MLRKILIFIAVLCLLMGVASAADDVNGTVIAIDGSANTTGSIEPDSLEIGEDETLAGEGRFLDVSEAYAYLNEFRTEPGVWQLNEDDSTRTYFNTNDTIWLVPLERDPDLEATAKVRAMELVEIYDHVRPDGTWCFSAFPDGYLPMGENIAMGYVSAKDVTEAWKETDDPYDYQGHRRNMLDSTYNRVGIAAYELDGTIYWVQDFGCKYDPRPVNNTDVFSAENNSKTPTFKIEMPVYATGYFSVRINGKEVSRKAMFQGKSEIVIYGLKAGTYDVELVYGGDNNYESFNRTFRVTALGDDDSGSSFRYLNTLVNTAADEALLERDYAFDENTDSDYIEGIVVPQHVIINGQGHTVDGRGLARIFWSLESITLKNIRLVNAVSKDCGGAVLSYNLALLDNCTFANNSAGLYGGAVYAVNQIYAEYSNTFINNSAFGCGGAIFGEVAVITANSSFINNTAGNLGGAVYAQGVLHSENSYYEANTNVQAYSCMSFWGSGNVMDDDFSQVFKNATVDSGVVNIGRDLTATQTILVNASNVTIRGNGHTINASGKTRIFFATADNLTIRDVTLVGGFSVADGGAIYAGDCNITLINVTFRDNIANTGGAVSSFNGNVFVFDSTFTDNDAQAGGALYSDYGNVTVSGSVFKNNDAKDYGGGAIYSGSWINVTSSLIEGSDALKYGGAIFTMDVLHLTDCVFENNTSQLVGGVFNANKGAVIINSTFANNYAAKHGGVFSAYGDVSAEGCTFTANSAGERGGVMYAPYSGATVRSSEFISNSAGTSAAALYSQNNVTVENSSFVGNSAPDGAINITSPDGVLNVDDKTTSDTPLAQFTSVSIETVDVQNATYGGEVIITVRVIDNNGIALSFGNVSAVFAASKYCANVTGGEAKIIISGLDAGTYSAELSYAYGEQYPDSSSVTFKVSPLSVTVGLVNSSVDYGGSLCVNVTSQVMAVSEGRVMISLNGKNYVAEVSNGIAVLNISDLAAGDYNGDLYYTAVSFKNATKSVSFTVLPAAADLEISVNDADAGNSVIINATVKSSYGVVNEGNVSVSVNGHNYSADVKDGIAVIEIPDLAVGNYSATAYFTAVNFTGAEKAISFRVLPLDAAVGLVNDTVEYGGVLLVNVTSNGMPVDEGNVVVSINNKNFSTWVMDGIAVVDISDLAAGDYDGDLYYASFRFRNVTEAVSFTVVPAAAKITAEAGDVDVGNSVIINARVESSNKLVKEGSVSVSVDGHIYSADVKDGLAVIEIPDLAVGNYPAIIHFSAANFTALDQQVSFRVYLTRPNLTVSIKNITYGESLQVSVGVSANGMPIDEGYIKVSAGNVANSTNVAGGRASLTLAGLDAGTYLVTVAYGGSDNYSGANVSLRVSVAKKTVTITAYDKSYSINSGGKYSVEVPTGENVRFTLSGKDLGIKTAAGGIATVDLTSNILKTAKAGKRDLVIELVSANYVAKKTVKITISKDKTKITATKKTFKAKVKTKKYAVTLKTSNNKAVKNVKVYIKVKGKTYTAKTNSKGKATFKITKLTKRGKHTATITFKGDSCYIKATKKVKITVK